MVCERCDGKSVFLKQQALAILEQKGLEPSVFVRADSRTRLELIREHFHLDEVSSIDTREILPNAPKNLGLIIIKPEMVQAQCVIEQYLTGQIGVKILSSTDFIYKPQEYWALHGAALADYHDLFPHGALLFLLFVTAPSRLVTFEHFTALEYQEILRKKHSGVNVEPLREGDDLQAIFTKYFVRGGPDSIRKTVCGPEIARTGLLSMDSNSCPAICWDFTGSFGQRTTDQNARTFNGIHSPRDRSELLLDLSVLKRLL